MDPISRAVLEYDAYLREGGRPLDLFDQYPYEPHQSARTLSPSGLCLCDRKAAYGVMEDMGEIEADIPMPDSLLVDFRIGNILEDFVAQAMEWKGALVAYQTRMTNGTWKGRLDFTVDPSKLGVETEELWRIEMKTVKSKDPNLLRDRYPKEYHIAQAEMYDELDEVEAVPMLYYALRCTFHGMLVRWNWTNIGAACLVWTGNDWKMRRTLKMIDKFRDSHDAQEKWLKDGVMPQRIGFTPDEHPFMCCNKNWKKKIATPNCKYFGRCWNTKNFKPFRIGGFRA